MVDSKNDSKKPKTAAPAKSPETPRVNQMWGGQFSSAPAELLAKINVSVGFDKKLYRQDIRGSIAHAKMLARQKIIADADAKAIIDGLKAILADIEAGNFTFDDG